jgi:CzcA family heavy metal efflux pump
LVVVAHDTGGDVQLFEWRKESQYGCTRKVPEMMHWIIRSSMQLQYLIIILAGVLVVFGLTQLRDMPVDVFPEFNPPLVEVQTEALGLAAPEVEAFVTTPLEADLLNGVAWLDHIYSESVAGLSSILLVFEAGTDPIKARQMVQERLTQAHALPKVSKPPVMLQPLSTTSRAMIVGLTSSEVSLIDMSVLAHWTIKPPLIGVPGVANVAIWGQRDWQLQVQVDPARLYEAGVTLDQIVRTTGNALWASPLSYLEASTPGNAGWIDTPNQRLNIMHLLPISTAKSMAEVVIAGTDEVVLGDVAEVVEDHQPLIGDALLNEGPALLLVIEKFPGANTLEVTHGVEAALEAMRPGLAGIQIDTTVFRPANYIEQAASNLATVLAFSAVLAVLVLVAFFFGWRAPFISLATILLSLMAALVVLYLRGATFNMMILAGLVVALVVIVDDAIIDVDHIARRLRQQHEVGNTQSAAAVILQAIVEMRSAIIFALLIVVLAALPILLLEGLAGTFFQPLAASYVLAVVVSMLVALIVTPALSVMLLANASLGHEETPLLQGLQRLYTGILSRTIQAWPLALIITGAIIVIGLVAVPALRLSLIPSFKETDLRLQWQGAPGTSRAAMVRILSRACAELKTIPGVRNCGSQVGRAVTGDQVVGINSGELWLSIDPAADYHATLTAVREVTDSYPGLFDQVETYEPERLGGALTGPDHDVVVRIYGNDFAALRQKTEEVRQLVSEVDGVVETQVATPIEEPQIEIEVKLATAERYQMSPGDVRRAVTTLLSGLVVGNLYEAQKVFDVVVIGAPEIRNNLTDIQELLIDTPTGQVPLGELADIRIAPSPSIIKRDAVSRFMDVGANVSGRDLGTVAADIQARLKGIAFPLEFRAQVLDDGIQWQAANQRTQIVTLIAVVGIFFLLQAAFGSWRLALVALLTLPAALAGGVVAVFLGSGVLSLGSLFGFLGVLAIAVRHVIVTTTYYQRLETFENASSRLALVLHGARDRLGAILMTALTTGLALLPLLLVGNIAGTEIVRPMAGVILAGLAASTFVNLFIVPALYLRYAPASVVGMFDLAVSAGPGLDLGSAAHPPGQNA